MGATPFTTSQRRAAASDRAARLRLTVLTPSATSWVSTASAIIQPALVSI